MVVLGSLLAEVCALHRFMMIVLFLGPLVASGVMLLGHGSAEKSEGGELADSL